MGLRGKLCGAEMDRMPNIAFRFMSLSFKIMDIFCSREKRVGKFDIKEGFTVLDYGCGPGRYIEPVSRLVGEKGKVYAADIHELAIKAVKKKIVKRNLRNVEAVLINGYSCGINDRTADAIYVLDTFHMVKDTDLFLKELHRIIKKDGFLIIDEGHQSRDKAKMKIESSKVWNIVEEAKDHLKCSPV